MLAQARLEVVGTDSGELVLVAPGALDRPEVVARIASEASPEQMRAAAERLAACWNLCRGAPRELIADSAARAGLPERLQALAAQMRRQGVGAIDGAPAPSHWHG